MYIVGIDEAGRGPLAGPVAVGVVAVPGDFDWALIPGVGDSKQVSPKKRLIIFEQAQVLKTAGMLNFRVELASAQVIDQIGIVPTIKHALTRGLEKLALASTSCRILLDGSLTAPVEFQQQTIIRGDATEPVIGLASILAKVTRDRYMAQLAEQPAYYPYAFDTHKGYGTKSHRESIVAHGLSTEHRVSYCQNINLWGRL